MTTQKQPSPPSATLAPESAWRKSSYSSQDNGNCVEIAGLGSQVGIRDSKVPHGPALLSPATAWSTFVEALKGGRLEG